MYGITISAPLFFPSRRNIVNVYDTSMLSCSCLSHTGGNFTGMMREMGLYKREVVMYSQAIEHFRHIFSQRGKQVGRRGNVVAVRATGHGRRGRGKSQPTSPAFDL